MIPLMECVSTSLWIICHPWLQPIEPLQQHSRFLDVGVLCFKGHLQRLGEITCTHNLECSAADYFLVVLEASFQIVACLVIFTVVDDCTSWSEDLRILNIWSPQDHQLHVVKVVVGQLIQKKSFLQNRHFDSLDSMCKRKLVIHCWLLLGQTCHFGRWSADFRPKSFVPPSFFLVDGWVDFSRWSTFFLVVCTFVF